MKIQDMVEGRRGRARFVLLFGTLVGLGAVLFYLFFRPNPNITFDVFYSAAEQSMGGEVIYRTEHGLYVYTPVVLLFFYPFVYLFDFWAALLAMRILNVFVAFGYGLLLARFLESHTDISRVDYVLITLFTTASVYPVSVVALANFNIIFGACLGIGFILLERNDDRGGAAWALASLVKVFPALWGCYLLRTRRWRSVIAAVGTGIGATALGIIVFGLDAYNRYLTQSASSRVRIERFAGGVSPDNEAITPVRSFAQLFPTIDPHLWVPVIAVAVIVLTGIIYYLVPADTVTNRVTLLLATVLGVILLMPTSQDQDIYVVYAPLLFLLYLERNVMVHSLYLVGTVILSFNIGREEISTATEAVNPIVSDVIVSVSRPILTFAPMPLYGIIFLYVGCLTSAWYKSTERKRIPDVVYD